MMSESPEDKERVSGPTRALAPIEAAPGYALAPVDGGGGGEEEPGTDPRRLLAAVLRYKWLVAAGGVLGAVAGFGMSRFKAPVYQAQATIWIEPGAGPRGPIQEGQLLQNTNWLDLLRSYTVLDSVVEEQRLFL